jgi:hypothetical protein
MKGGGVEDESSSERMVVRSERKQKIGCIRCLRYLRKTRAEIIARWHAAPDALSMSRKAYVT